MVPHLVRRKVLDPNFQLPALSASASAFLNPPAEGERGGVQAAKGNKLDLERVSEGLAVELFQSAISSGAALADSVERAHVGDFASHLLSKSAKTLEVLNPTDLPPEVSNREIVFHLLLFGCVVMKGGHVRAEFLGPGQCPPDIACNCLRGHEMAHDRADAHLTATPMCSKLQYQCLVATPESLDRPFHEVRLPEKEEEEELINDGGR
uniref:Uncharacterized protein n=1 Tax=Chromera velia CCMP2878 TaxID=1169474 RepID=A0A0G4HRP0_9ALVE|eukprot:Cvel_8108.t1-p1 / transcript=Cvel_8108.t1 / gene=Cvel_8108 / organism=Chromera_velia_CCMP2878 / gene_product=hypothetical protein / transcript_product=hypothetical protein / location=Cvel_scaffold441:16883-18231(-) / protein_length=207 / sequence_SO=supercontig / SO=protein_coding / is_pseudo=false